MFQTFTSSQNIGPSFVWQSIIELVEGHLALKEEEEFVNVDNTTKKNMLYFK